MSDHLKTIYFVRHGQTWSNQRLVFQTTDEPLSETGHKQAAAVANWFQGQGIDTLATSPYPRAAETAACISEKTGLSVTPLSSVTELHRPTIVHGSSYFSLAVFRYLWQLYWHREDPNWLYGRAENLVDIRKRIEEAKVDIASLPGERIAVVSHRFFIALFVVAVCAKGPLKLADTIRQFFIFFKVKNTSVFKFTLDTKAPDNTCKWRFEGIEYNPSL